MKKILLPACLALLCLVADAGAQFYTSETARKDAEAEKEFALHTQVFRISRESLNARIEEAKKLRSRRPQ